MAVLEALLLTEASCSYRMRGLYGEEIDDRESEAEAQVQVSGHSPVLQMRTPSRVYARFRSLPHLLQGARARGTYPWHKEVILVDMNLVTGHKSQVTSSCTSSSGSSAAFIFHLSSFIFSI